MIIKNIDDPRAMTDIGSAIFIRREEDTKYHLWLPVSNLPASGSSPETVETTVTTSRAKTYTYGRQDRGQKEFTFNAHRDNFRILNEDYNKKFDFLQVNPDGTGWKFAGAVSYFQDEVSVGGNLTGKGVITVASSDEKITMNVLDLIEDTITFVSTVPDYVKLTGTGTNTINIVTDPEDATLTVESDTEGVATASVSDKAVTITGVAAGSAIITIKATKSGFADGYTTILVEDVAQ